MFLYMKQRYSNLEIAEAALCSESAVKKAVERGLSDDLASLVGWVLLQRLKSLSLSGVDETVKQKTVFPKTVTAENVKDVVDGMYRITNMMRENGDER